MPKVNMPTKANRRATAIKSVASVGRMFRVFCSSGQKFAEVLGASVPTACARLKAPETMTLEELATAVVNMGISCDIRLTKDEISTELHW